MRFRRQLSIHRSSYAFLGMAAAVLGFGGCQGSHDDTDTPSASDAGAGNLAPTTLPVPDAAEALRELQAQAPSMQLVRSPTSDIRRLFGTTLASGGTPAETVRTFVARAAGVWALHPADIVPESGANRPVARKKGGTDAEFVPLQTDSTGQGRFLLAKYRQVRNGIPVHGGELRFLIRNAPGYPLVHISSATRPVGGYVPVDVRGNALTAGDPALDQIAAGVDVRSKIQAAVGNLFTHFAAPEIVIWAGREGTVAVPPRLALVVVADNGAPPSGEARRERFVLDPTTGEVLDRENLVLFADVHGQVNANITPDTHAAECSTPVVAPLPYASVGLPDANTTTYADTAGAFRLTTSSEGPVSLASPVSGRWFTVRDEIRERDEVLTAQANGSEPVAFLHNPSGSDEFAHAQVNVYAAANQVRDWVLAKQPSYPVLGTEEGFPIVANATSIYCPGNAWYDGMSLTFCAAGEDSETAYANTGFGSVVHHEYGHHVVDMGGSGQGEYGEGMADTLGALITGEAGQGYGFFSGRCDTPLRTVANDCKYTAYGCSTCGQEVHSCGMLLSGAIWSVRQALGDADQDGNLLATLTLDSILLHTGNWIDPAIAADFLTLDDDDGNIDNGTPHRVAICQGFEAHDLTCPALAIGLTVNGANENWQPQGEVGGPFTSSTKVFVLDNMGPGSIQFEIASDAPWLKPSLASGTLSVGEKLNLTATVTDAANALPEGLYGADIRFTDVTNSQTTKRHVKLTVGHERLQYRWTLDQNPGWATTGAWQFGQPTGQGSYYVDPKSGHTGHNVYGYNLTGDYEASRTQEDYLTAGPIDLTGLANAKLKFWRWLGVEGWDHASIEVGDGTTWTTIFRNPYRRVYDEAWTPVEYDISSYVDGKSNVFVRWTMGYSDEVIQSCGWNVDDIEIDAIGRRGAGCSADADCDDHDFCNGVEVCQRGGCSLGTPSGEACYAARPLAVGQDSGSFGTTGEMWFALSSPVHGWQATNTDGRTIRVNGTVVQSGGALPAPIDGKYYFQFTEGRYAWTSLRSW